MVYVRVDLTFNYNYNNASENIEQNMYTVDFFVSSGLYNQGVLGQLINGEGTYNRTKKRFKTSYIAQGRI